MRLILSPIARCFDCPTLTSPTSTSGININRSCYISVYACQTHMCSAINTALDVTPHFFQYTAIHKIKSNKRNYGMTYILNEIHNIFAGNFVIELDFYRYAQVSKSVKLRRIPIQHGAQNGKTINKLNAAKRLKLGRCQLSNNHCHHLQQRYDSMVRIKRTCNLHLKFAGARIN